MKHLCSSYRHLWWSFAALLAAVVVSACGGNGGDAATGAPQPHALTALPPPPAPVANVVSLTKVGETRVSRTVYDYVFKVTLQNGNAAQTGITANLVSAGQGTSIVDGAVAVGDMAANATATPQDTITLRQDRNFAFDAAALVWNVVATLPPVTFFEDNFTDAALANWSRQTAFSNCCGAGIPAQFSLENTGVTDPLPTDGSYLKINMAGGSCGYCGVPDGSYLTPNMTGVTGDVVAEMRYKELFRQPLGQGLNSLVSIAMHINLTAGAGSLGSAGSSGDGTPWNQPDNSIISTYAVYGQFNSGIPTRIDFPPQTYHTIVVQFERTGDTAVWRVQIDNDGVWHQVGSATILSSVPILPSLTVSSGHWIGYPTQTNGGGMFLVDYFKVYRR